MSFGNQAEKSFKSRALLTSALCSVAAASAMVATPAAATIVPDTTTPAAVIDTTNTRPAWVGLGIRNEAGNGGSTCTGLLINPRTVLFAAHCVDGLQPGAYDGNAPGNRAQVGYTTDPTFGNANLRNWLFSQDFGPQPGNDGRTMNGNSVMVWYDPRSRNGPARPAGDGTFLPADVAIAGFDTPNEILGRDAQLGIGLMFSPVNGLVPVTVGGYGQSGTEPGTTRASDFQRRLGTNMLGFLGNQRDINLGVYGPAISDILSPSTSTFQDLYWVDFDDPRRATRGFFNGPGTRPIAEFTFDFDVFPGNATANEVGTAPGDSGSPLVTNAFGRDVSLGVLSQGSRFFFESLGNPNDNLIRTCQNTNVGANFSCLGTISGYNPLFLFWDQIVVNNPYKYVTTRSGDGEWTDATRWVQEIDPLYFTLAGSTLTNALPTAAGLGVSGATPNVGTVRPNPSPPALCAFTGTCPPTGGTSEPAPALPAGNRGLPDTEDLRLTLTVGGETPVEVDPNHETRITGSDANTAYADVMLVGQPAHTTNANETVIPGTPADTALTTALWTSGTLIPVNTGALTGPGTTNFVANNVIGTAGLQNSTRWFEVNLRAAGTTFLTNANITIDRLNVRGAQSGLNIRSNGTLTTVMSSFVDAGMVTVDGQLTARQLTVGGGMVGGTGTIAVRDGLLVTGGVVSPGALGGGVGTLNVTGPATFSGAGMLGIDITSPTAADRLNVTGRLTLGGTLAVNSTAAYQPRFGTVWTIGSATGGITGSFNNFASNLQGVLRPEALISGNDLQLRINALPFDAFLAGRATKEQLAIGTALNQVRSVAGTGSAADLFAGIDVLDAPSLAAAFERMKPTNALAVNQNVRLENGVQATAIFDRLARTRSAERGKMAVSVTGANNMFAGTRATSNTEVVGNMMLAAAEESGSTMAIPEEWSIFASATYAYGKADIQSNSSSDPTAWTFTVGADRKISDNFILGVAGSYQSGNADLSLVGNSIDSKGWSANAYAAFDLSDRMKLDTWFRYGKGSLDTVRVQTLGTSTFTSVGDTDTKTTAWGATLSNRLNDGPVTFTPVLSAVSYNTDIDGYTEAAGSAALRIDAREVDSLQFKAGMEVAGDWSSGSVKFRPYGRVSAVWETNNEPDVVTARFVAGGAGAVPFNITGADPSSNFAELAAGFSVEGSETLTFSVEATKTIGRSELETGSVSLTGRLRF